MKPEKIKNKSAEIQGEKNLQTSNSDIHYDFQNFKFIFLYFIRL